MKLSISFIVFLCLSFPVFGEEQALPDPESLWRELEAQSGDRLREQALSSGFSAHRIVFFPEPGKIEIEPLTGQPRRSDLPAGAGVEYRGYLAPQEGKATRIEARFTGNLSIQVMEASLISATSAPEGGHLLRYFRIPSGLHPIRIVLEEIQEPGILEVSFSWPEMPESRFSMTRKASEGLRVDLPDSPVSPPFRKVLGIEEGAGPIAASTKETAFATLFQGIHGKGLVLTPCPVRGEPGILPGLRFDLSYGTGIDLIFPLFTSLNGELSEPWFFPVNLNLPEGRLLWSTAAPVLHANLSGSRYLAFRAWSNEPVEFGFSGIEVQAESISPWARRFSLDEDRLSVVIDLDDFRELQCSMGPGEVPVRIYVLTPEQWKGAFIANVGGVDRLIWSRFPIHIEQEKEKVLIRSELRHAEFHVFPGLDLVGEGSPEWTMSTRAFESRVTWTVSGRGRDQLRVLLGSRDR